MAWPGKLFCKISDFRWTIKIYLNTILVYNFSKNKCDTYIFICVYFIVVKKKHEVDSQQICMCTVQHC